MDEISPFHCVTVVRSVSTSIASKQMRLVRASMTIYSQACKYISSHLDRSGEVSTDLIITRMRFLHVGRNDITYVMLKIIGDMKL